MSVDIITYSTISFVNNDGVAANAIIERRIRFSGAFNARVMRFTDNDETEDSCALSMHCPR